ncbi:aldo/keto reductase [Noviherbaspirillum sp.]|uniref:aldo/keto reductase n=1 Tax=Noviherbaspirillum sp. TaxID=1926288 RepID=UPI002FDF6C18
MKIPNEEHQMNDVPLHAPMTRATFLRLAMAGTFALGTGIGGRALSATQGAAMNPQRMHTRPIPSSGEALPVIGCGTWQTFDVGAGSDEHAPLAEVLRILFEAGGSVIDSSPMYGRSEAVVGELLKQAGMHDKAFVATKVWTRGRDAGIRQMRESMKLLQDERIELMQIHNLVDWRTHLKTLRGWKQEGRIRHLGITHYTASAYDELEAIMRAEPLDFVQLNYSLAEREAEARLLPLAADRGIAVLVNQPFGGGRLLRDLAGTPLPPWAKDIECETWAQILLKYVLGNPAVTCAIPGTSRPKHMVDNCRAGMGALPDTAMRKKMAAFWAQR